MAKIRSSLQLARLVLVKHVPRQSSGNLQRARGESSGSLLTGTPHMPRENSRKMTLAAMIVLEIVAVALILIFLQ
jgi:hypothetical protein